VFRGETLGEQGGRIEIGRRDITRNAATAALTAASAAAIQRTTVFPEFKARLENKHVCAAAGRP